ncbi:hypothetical protein IKN40_07155 [bacterium]|jgi:hypothetical protein|nr:hypothetical protein [bacterium]
MEREKRLVTLSMVVLFFSLIVVYSLFYQVKGAAVFGTLRSIPAPSSRTPLAEKRAQVETQSIDSFAVEST